MASQLPFCFSISNSKELSSSRVQFSPRIRFGASSDTFVVVNFFGRPRFFGGSFGWFALRGPGFPFLGGSDGGWFIGAGTGDDFCFLAMGSLAGSSNLLFVVAVSIANTSGTVLVHVGGEDRNRVERNPF